MNILEMEIHSYLVNANPYHENNIELIYYEESRKSHLACHVPDYDTTRKCPNISLFAEFETLHDLIYEFILTGPADLKGITPESLYKRFLVGRCDLHCYLDPDMDSHLIFRWNKNQLFARNGNEDWPHEESHAVPPYVKTPGEIIIYTKHYFNTLAS